MSSRTLIVGVLWVLLVGSPLRAGASGEGGAHPDEAAHTETALCSVCRVHEGETEKEPIRATELFRGEEYHFCSEGCRERFLESPESYLTPVFPRPAPTYTVIDLEGSPVSSEEHRGQVTLLDFWATWCLPCVQDLSNLTELHERYADQGFQVVGISIDEGDRAPKKVRRMMRKKDVRHPIFLDSEETSAWAAFLVRAIPAQFLIDREGQIIAQWSGVIDLETVEAAVEQALKSES